MTESVINGFLIKEEASFYEIISLTRPQNAVKVSLDYEIISSTMDTIEEELALDTLLNRYEDLDPS